LYANVGPLCRHIQLKARIRAHPVQVIKTIRRMPDVQRVFRTLA
jgi:hypothetical protein